MASYNKKSALKRRDYLSSIGAIGFGESLLPYAQNRVSEKESNSTVPSQISAQLDKSSVTPGSGESVDISGTAINQGDSLRTYLLGPNGGVNSFHIDIADDGNFNRSTGAVFGEAGKYYIILVGRGSDGIYAANDMYSGELESLGGSRQQWQNLEIIRDVYIDAGSDDNLIILQITAGEPSDDKVTGSLSAQLSRSTVTPGAGEEVQISGSATKQGDSLRAYILGPGGGVDGRQISITEDGSFSINSGKIFDTTGSYYFILVGKGPDGRYAEPGIFEGELTELGGARSQDQNRAILHGVYKDAGSDDGFVSLKVIAGEETDPPESGTLSVELDKAEVTAGAGETIDITGTATKSGESLRTYILGPNGSVTAFRIDVQSNGRFHETTGKIFEDPGEYSVIIIGRNLDGQYAASGLLTGELSTLGGARSKRQNLEIIRDVYEDAASDDILVFLKVSATATSSQPEVAWRQTFGGSERDWFADVTRSSDGGAYLVGRTLSSGSGSGDGWVLKLSSDGTEQWRQTFGGSQDDWFNGVTRSGDGGVYISGSSYSSGSGSGDGWVLKLSSDGTEEWSQTFGGSLFDGIHDVIRTVDGGAYLIGGTDSFGSGSRDGWVLKLASDGTEQWRKTFGGSQDDWFKAGTRSSDGGAYLVGETASTGSGSADGWVLKLSSDGTEQWRQTFGGNEADWFSGITRNDDEGAYIVGGTRSLGDGSSDGWVLKLSSDGTEQWRQTFGGNEDDWFSGIIRNDDEGAYIVGGTKSLGDGSDDGWVLKLSSDGTEQWRQTFGGDGYDWFSGVTSSGDGWSYLHGITESSGNGAGDGWVLKLKRPDHDPSIPGSQQKLDLASTIDSHSVFSTIDARTDTSLDGDREMAETAIKNLETAVEEERISPEVGEEAVQRLQYGEEAAHLVVDYVGPHGDEDIDLAEGTARQVISFGVNLVLLLLTLKLAAVGIAGAAVALVSSAISSHFGNAMRSDTNDDIKLDKEVENACQREAQNIVDQIQNDTLTTASEVANEVDDVVDSLVDEYADSFRAIIEINRIDIILNAAGPAGTLWGTGEEVYGSLQRLHDAHSPEEIETGLPGSTTAAQTSKQDGVDALEQTMDEYAAELKTFEDIEDRTNLYSTIIDVLNDSDDVVTVNEFVNMVISVINELTHNALATVTSGSNTLVGILRFSQIKLTHDRLINGVIEGEEVEF